MAVYAIGLETFAIQVVEVVELDNHSLLGEGVGEEIRSPCLKGGGGGKPKPLFHVTCRGTADQFQRKRLSIMKSHR